ncbi:hypothetical protein ACH5RR_012031 [Cinchona calisaya]|uniref:Beta-glucosidase n=1 Tax=Cinchona calisaya TaxID=153742 RepID=A0ABD3A6I9_9GENT
MAVDSYHLYKEDVHLIRQMGFKALRISISWSRVLPGGRLDSGVNIEGIKYYSDLIDELLANERKIGISNVVQWAEPVDDSNVADVKAALRAFDFSFGW